MSIEVNKKLHFSYYHLNGAAFFARSAARIEKENNPPLKDDISTEYISSITSSILMSVAALESKINEVFLSAVDKNPNVFKDVEDWIVDSLKEIWPHLEKHSILTKYQIALIFSKKAEFKKGQNPFQDAAILVSLRNALVHYKPEWNNELDMHKKLESSLSTRFPHSRFCDKGDVFFPKKCLGHGCAAWAVNTSLKFIDEFYKRMGIHEAFKSKNNFKTA